MSEFNYETADAAQAEVQDDNRANASEVRAWLQSNPDALPEGVTVGARGRLSAKAREAFTAATGREVK